MDVFNAFKGIADMIRDAVEGGMPRQAVVTRSEGSGVWVRYTPVNVDSPEMWFPSNIADLPAGTSGWVHPLAGGKGRFIATAVPMVHSIAPYYNGSDPFNTTSINENTPFWYGADDIVREVTLAPGTWQFDLDASMFIRRNVTTGGWRLCLGVGDNRSSPITYQVTPHDQFHLTRAVWRTTISVEAVTVVPIRIGFCGWSTAGTTYGYLPAFTGTYTKIG